MGRKKSTRQPMRRRLILNLQVHYTSDGSISLASSPTPIISVYKLKIFIDLDDAEIAGKTIKYSFYFTSFILSG